MTARIYCGREHPGEDCPEQEPLPIDTDEPTSYVDAVDAEREARP